MLWGMKRLAGHAAAESGATPADCFELLAAVDRYPVWNPEVVRGAEVLERADDGSPTKARAKLHAEVGPVVKDFDLLLAVSTDRPRAVTLTRISDDRGDQEEFRVGWTVAQGPPTRIELRLDANLSVPRFVPVIGVGDSLAKEFVTAAVRALT